MVALRGFTRVTTTTTQRLRNYSPQAACISAVSHNPAVPTRHKSFFHTNPISSYAQNDGQNKDDPKPGKTEYSQSSGDDKAAETKRVAFSGEENAPEEELRKADAESGHVRFLDIY
jgi:hypothetical protein